MGYRSNVMCLIYPMERNGGAGEERYNLIKTLMGTQFKNILDKWGEYFTWIDSKKILKFEANDIKWYESYPDVSEFIEMYEFFMENLDEQICVEFCRIGEEYNDIEITNSSDLEYLLRVNRTIETDF